MLIGAFDHYRLLLPWHRQALAELEPGDLSQSHGEWLFAAGGASAFIARSLHALADAGGFHAGIWQERSLVGS